MNNDNEKKSVAGKRNNNFYTTNSNGNNVNRFYNKTRTGRKPYYQRRNTGYNRKPPVRKEVVKPSIKIAFLGGLNEIGKNITLFECMGDMFILDCGMAFPDGEMLGIDLVLPDFTYVRENVDKIKGIIITHGHEDHIGSLPYLLKDVSLPVYGTPLSMGLVGNKLKEHNLLSSAQLNVVHAGDVIKMGCMNVELIHVNHSIPDSVGVVIHSPAGTIVHTGDFKIDFTPATGDVIDLTRFAELGKEGVLALMADSTNAERPGFTKTEAKVRESFENLFIRAKNKRIIIATFASNVNRIQQILDCAKANGRKVAFSGRSMLNYVQVATELGYMEVSDGTVIDIDSINEYLPEQIVLVTTGSQGEPMSALSRMAYSEHRKVAVGTGDFIIISANPIPGNEKMVGNVIDELLKLGCEVVYESMYEVHVSGHACQEELKVIHNLVRPEFFIPVHGEQKHLKKHADLAESLGMKRDNIFIGDVGNVVELKQGGMKRLGDVVSGKVFVDGLGVGDVGSIVLRDRKHLGQDGLIIIVAALDIAEGYIISGPDVISRGFVYVRESEEIIYEVRRIAMEILQEFALKNIHEWNVIKNKIKEEVSKHIFNKTRRTPMILPIIMEV
ncbi:MAG: ribonuclease J [Clostridia bacterium]|nr:ribonuclease J [Clostridia bacterium]